MVEAPAWPTAGESGAVATHKVAAHPLASAFHAALGGAQGRALAAEAARRAQEPPDTASDRRSSARSDDDRSDRRVAVVDLAAIAKAELASPGPERAAVQQASAEASTESRPTSRGTPQSRPTGSSETASPGRAAPERATPQAPPAVPQSKPSEHAPLSAHPPASSTTDARPGQTVRTSAASAGGAAPAVAVTGASAARAVAAAPSATSGSPPSAPAVGVVGSRTAGAADRRAAATPRPAVPHGASAQESEQQDEIFAAQVGRGLAAVLRQGGGSVLLRLQPEALGALKVRLDLHEGVVTARFEASSDQARQLLDEGLPELKAALEARGLAVERLEVRAAPAPTERAQDPAAAERPQDSEGAFGGADGGESGPGGHEPEDRGGAAATWREDPLAVATDGDRDDGSDAGETGGAPALADLYTGGAHGLSIGLDAVA